MMFRSDPPMSTDTLIQKIVSLSRELEAKKLLREYLARIRDPRVDTSPTTEDMIKILEEIIRRSVILKNSLAERK